MGYPLDLRHPRTFSEKMQWLKLHDRDPLYTMLVDKLAVRAYIAKTIGEEYLVPLIGVFDRAEDIRFDELPETYVLKCTHDSGSVMIKNGNCTLSQEEIRERMRRALRRRFYYEHREWPYKNIKPRIICEALLESGDGLRPFDYKFSCFNGECDAVMVCTDRETGNTKFYLYDEQWCLLPYQTDGQALEPPNPIAPPSRLQDLFAIAKQLSAPFVSVRVDLYCVNDRIYFSEFTFFSQAGYYYDFKVADEEYGAKIDLSRLKRPSDTKRPFERLR
jgi:hypothetical protein